jgi:hypothetical protein
MIMVGSAASVGGLAERRQLVAVVVTVAKGYDLGYVWKNQGRADAEKASGGYARRRPQTETMAIT